MTKLFFSLGVHEAGLNCSGMANMCVPQRFGFRVVLICVPTMEVLVSLDVAIARQK
jgi:hypothetical protein